MKTGENQHGDQSLQQLDELLEEQAVSASPESAPAAAKMRANLARSCEIIDAVFALKAAWEQSRHPELSRAEIEQRVCRGILERKQRQWTSPAD